MDVLRTWVIPHESGYPILVRQNGFDVPVQNKWFCGYVGIDNTHPCYELHDHEIYERYGDQISPHGGITYYNFSEDRDKDLKSDYKYYWIGFDCNHLGDENIGYDFVAKEAIGLADALWSLNKNTKQFNLNNPDGIREYIRYIFKEE